MVTAVLILVLLTIAASLASWLFGQWLAGRTRISGAALAVGGAGAVLMIGTVAFVVIGASTWWQRLMPVQDPSPLATAERHLQRSDYAKAVDVAQQYLAEHPGDPEMTSLLARSLFAAEHPGSASSIPAAVVAEWPATGCVAPTRSEESSRWLLDNGCGRVVAVLFASCQSSETVCFTNALVSQAWTYEPTGILLTAANDRPLPLRLGKAGPLVAPIFAIRDDAGTRRQIRYLACEVTAPGVLQVLRSSGGEELTEQRLTAELRADACYSRVLDWSRSGQRYGRSPDTLLRIGID